MESPQPTATQERCEDMATARAQNNKRIAKNTGFLYVRMLVVMAVTLYTSRIILEALGVEDFGIYNVVGGLAASFMFFSTSLSNSTQRFLNIALGGKNKGLLRKIFNLSLLVYGLIAVVVFIVIAFFGHWLLDAKLVIPPDRMVAANWVLWCFTISLCLTFVGTAYDSVLIAHENMKIFAWVGVADAFLKLAIAYIILYVQDDKLILYAVLIMVATLLTRAMPAIYCHRIYSECRLERVWDKSLFGALFGFTGWNLVGCFVMMLNNQGISILLNMFFGPVVNAAKGIATQVDSAVTNFSANFFVAVRPQIVKQYAQQKISDMVSLVFNSSRYGFYLMWIISLPLMLRIDYVLHLWLTEVPEYTGAFVIWIMVYNLVNVLTNPWWSAIQAVGRLRWYTVIGSSVFLLAFPLGWVCLKEGYSPITVFMVLAIVRMIYLWVVINVVRRYLKFSRMEYFKKAFLPICIVVAITWPISYIINHSLPAEGFWTLVSVVADTVIVNCIVIYMMATKSEREFLKAQVRKFSHRL